jgi:hypothetical protein
MKTKLFLTALSVITPLYAQNYQLDNKNYYSEEYNYVSPFREKAKPTKNSHIHNEIQQEVQKKAVQKSEVKNVVVKEKVYELPSLYKKSESFDILLVISFTVLISSDSTQVNVVESGKNFFIDNSGSVGLLVKGGIRTDYNDYYIDYLAGLGYLYSSGYNSPTFDLGVFGYYKYTKNISIGGALEYKYLLSPSSDVPLTLDSAGGFAPGISMIDKFSSFELRTTLSLLMGLTVPITGTTQSSTLPLDGISLNIALIKHF